MKRISGWIGCAVAVALAMAPACKKDETAKPAQPKTTDNMKPDHKTPDGKTPDTKTPDGKTPDTKMASTGNPIADRVIECQALWLKHDAALAGCFTDDAVAEMSGMPDKYTGYKDIDAKMETPFITAFPDISIDPVLGLVNGNHFVGVAVVTGTNTGSFMGAPATGKKMGMLGLREIEFDADGKRIKHDLHVADMGTMAAQLGMSPMPARAVMDKPTDKPVIAVATNSPAETANVATVTKLCAAFDKHDADAIGGMTTDDVVMTDVTAPADMQGKDKFVGVMKTVMKAFPDIKGTCASWGAGDYVYNSVDWTGTNKGAAPEFGIMKATEKKVAIHDSEIYQFNKDGKIVHYWRFSNGMAMAMQLGLMPPPGGAPEKMDEGGKGQEPPKPMPKK